MILSKTSSFKFSKRAIFSMPTMLLSSARTAKPVKPVKDAFYMALSHWRKEAAVENGIAQYAILNERDMSQIMAIKPTTIDEFKAVPGIGPKKTVFATSIVEIVKKHINGTIAAELVHTPITIPDTSAFWDTPEKKKKKNIETKVASTDIGGTAGPTFTPDMYSAEQFAAADCVLRDKKNVFITGAAGTGKSYLLRYIAQELQAQYGRDHIGLLAPTGIAAVNIGGQTLNSFAGIGLGKFLIFFHIGCVLSNYALLL